MTATYRLTATGSQRQMVFISDGTPETCPLTKCENPHQIVADSEPSQEIHVSG